MVRRIASQVHKQAGRLLQANYIREEPAWYRAVLDHPPLPLPPRAPPARPHDDTPRTTPVASSKHMRPRSPRPLPIYYVEDDVRRQFFRDHPFEAYRERSLVESGAVEDEHSIRGEAWTRLRQRGATPCSETYVSILEFAFSLF
jgi:small subunit ribosomal protein S23